MEIKIKTDIFVVIAFLVLLLTQAAVGGNAGLTGGDYGDTNGGNSTNGCYGDGCDYNNQDFNAPVFMEEDKIWTEVQAKLNSNVTIDFVKSFDTPFKQRMIFEQLTACPYVPMCEFDLGVQHLKEYSKILKNCCWPCSCEYPDCLEHKTCCLDIVYRHSNVSDFLKTDSKPQKFCEMTYLSNGAAPDHTYPVEMTSSCPRRTPEPLRSNCTKAYSKEMRHFKEFVPVYHEDTLELYRNAYCAYCHNILDDKLQTVEVWIGCDGLVSAPSESDMIKYAMTVEDCHLRYEFQQEVKPSLEYCLYTVSSCNQTGKWLDYMYDRDLELACGLHRAVIQINGTNYQNVFCALCNGIVVDNPNACEWVNSIGGSEFSFSGLLKLKSEQNVENKIHDNNKCSEDQLFDSIYGKCRNMFCSPHKNLRYGACVDIYSKLQYIVYTVFLKITPLEPLTVLEANSAADDVLDMVKKVHWLEAEVCGLQMIYTSVGRTFDNSTISVAEILESPFKAFEVRAELTFAVSRDPNPFIEMVLSLNQLESSILYYDEVLSEMKSLKLQMHVIDRNSDIFDEIGKITNFTDYYKPFFFDVPIETMINFFAGSGLSDDRKVFEFAHIRGNDQLAKCRNNFFKIDVLRMKSCPQIALALDDIKIKENDNGVLIERGNYLIKHSEYYVHENGSFVICVDVYKKYMAFMHGNNDGHSLSAETIVSVVFSSLSIACLSVTLVVFILLPNLRNSLPGKNNLCLVVVLLCAQSMYLVTGLGALDVGSPACVAFGMILHFTWLMSLFWMNVCTYHMFHVLSRTMAISKNSGICRFMIYHLYVIIMAAIPVTINSSVAMTTSGLYGYGAVVCYISTQKMVIFTFGIPVAFVVVSNIVMFLLVMIKIKSTTMVQRNLKNERNNLVIFAKLSTITGVTWIFGFINMWTDVSFFSYVFIILNAGQGIFIMLAFVFNHRVLKMFKGDILGLSVSASTTGNGSTNNSFTRQPLSEQSSVESSIHNTKM